MFRQALVISLGLSLILTMFPIQPAQAAGPTKSAKQGSQKITPGRGPATGKAWGKGHSSKSPTASSTSVKSPGKGSSGVGKQTAQRAGQQMQRNKTIKDLNKSVKALEKDRNKQGRAKTATAINKNKAGLLVQQ